MDLSRLEYLIGEEKIKLLANKKVLIAGVGGVGSFVAEALARSGVGTLILYDYDVIDSSNINLISGVCLSSILLDTSPLT